MKFLIFIFGLPHSALPAPASPRRHSPTRIPCPLTRIRTIPELPDLSPRHLPFASRCSRCKQTPITHSLTALKTTINSLLSPLSSPAQIQFYYCAQSPTHNNLPQTPNSQHQLPCLHPHSLTSTFIFLARLVSGTFHAHFAAAPNPDPALRFHSPPTHPPLFPLRCNTLDRVLG